jgi:glycosyltransferase involved in cell wall biosynthesis
MIQAMKATKKVLYLITKATWGGAQRYVYDLAIHLPAECTAVIAYGTGGKLSDDLTAARIKTVQISSLQRDVAFLSDIESFFEILRCIRAEEPDVLHLNSSKAAALGALAGRLCGVKRIIFTVHGWPFREKRSALSKLFIWKISWFTALLSHTVICVSEHDLWQAMRMPFISRKAVRIYNGIDSHMQLGSGEIIRRAFPPGATITGTIGELTKNKNQQALIDEVRTNPHMYLAIVGEGEDRPMLENKIKECDLSARVKLFGFVPAHEVLKGFDIFALPSIKEGLPYVLLEAKAAGLPIIANRVGGVGEILDAKNLQEFSLERMVGQTVRIYLPPARAGGAQTG